VLFSLLIIVFILPISGRVQPKIGTINLFPQCGSNKLIFLKIMKRLILLFLVSFFYSTFALAGDCDTTVTGTENNQLTCSDNDTLTVTGTISYDGANAVLGNLIGDLTVINSGTIETTTSSGNHSAVKGQSSLNLTVTNSGTITGGNRLRN